jgi:hypothetical protein
MQEQKQSCPVQGIACGKRERLAHQCSESLAQGVVPALDVCRLPGSFPYPDMLRRREHGLVRLPEIRVAGGCAPGSGHLLPQIAAALLAAITQAASDNLPRVAVQRHPDPSRFGFRAHKRPKFVPLQDRSRAGPRGQHRAAQGRERRGFFFSQLVTVLRETPKVRVRPRRLERS